MAVKLFQSSYLAKSNNANDPENKAFTLSLEAKNKIKKISSMPVASEYDLIKLLIHKFLFKGLSSEQNNTIENLSETYFNAKKNHSELVSKWVLEHLPHKTAQEGYDFSMESLRQIDPSLLGESCIDPSDNFIRAILKTIFVVPYYQINQKLAGKNEIQKWRGRIEYFREKIEQEQIVSTFQSCFKDLPITKHLKNQHFRNWKVCKSAPQSIAEIQKFFAEDFPEYLTTLPLEEANEKIELYLKAKENFFRIIEKTICSDPEAIFSFEREKNRVRSEENEAALIHERLAKKYNGKVGGVSEGGFFIETKDRIIFFGDLIPNQIKLSLFEGLKDGDFSKFFYDKFIPTQVECFVVYKEKKNFEIQLKTDHLGHIKKVGKNGYKDISSTKMSISKKIRFHIDNGIVFDENPFRMGIILKDFETYLQGATSSQLWLANSYLSKYKESGISLTLNLHKIHSPCDNNLKMFFGMEDQEKILMDGGEEPDFLLKRQLPSVIKFLEFDFSMLTDSFNDLVLEPIL